MVLALRLCTCWTFKLYIMDIEVLTSFPSIFSLFKCCKKIISTCSMNALKSFIFLDCLLPLYYSAHAKEIACEANSNCCSSIHAIPERAVKSLIIFAETRQRIHHLHNRKIPTSGVSFPSPISLLVVPSSS